MTGSFNVTLWSRVQSVNALQIFCVWYWMSLASAVESERGTLYGCIERWKKGFDVVCIIWNCDPKHVEFYS